MAEYAGRCVALCVMALYAREERRGQQQPGVLLAVGELSGWSGTSGLPWADEVIDLLDEIAVERLPDHLTAQRARAARPTPGRARARRARARGGDRAAGALRRGRRGGAARTGRDAQRRGARADREGHLDARRAVQPPAWALRSAMRSAPADADGRLARPRRARSRPAQESRHGREARPAGRALRGDTPPMARAGLPGPMVAPAGRGGGRDRSRAGRGRRHPGGSDGQADDDRRAGGRQPQAARTASRGRGSRAVGQRGLGALGARALAQRALALLVVQPGPDRRPTARTPPTYAAAATGAGSATSSPTEEWRQPIWILAPFTGKRTETITDETDGRDRSSSGAIATSGPSRSMTAPRCGRSTEPSRSTWAARRAAHGRLARPPARAAGARWPSRSATGWSRARSDADGAQGWCDRRAREIVVNRQRPANARVRILVHEIAHAHPAGKLDYEHFTRAAGRGPGRHRDLRRLRPGRARRRRREHPLRGQLGRGTAPCRRCTPSPSTVDAVASAIEDAIARRSTRPTHGRSCPVSGPGSGAGRPPERRPAQLA